MKDSAYVPNRQKAKYPTVLVLKCERMMMWLDQRLTWISSVSLDISARIFWANISAYFSRWPGLWSYQILLLIHGQGNDQNPLVQPRLILLASMAQLDARPTGVAGSTPPGRQHSFVEIDHDIFPTVTLSLPLIQKKAVVSFWRKNVYNIG